MQAALFQQGAPAFDASFHAARRSHLGRGAWFDYVPGWMQGDLALFDSLRAACTWNAGSREMYGREVAVPRLTAGFPEHPFAHRSVIEAASRALSARYGWSLDRLTCALYRDGHDSVAFHGDKMGPLRKNTVIAVLSLGGPRTFRLRPRGGGASLGFAFGHGDLVVMGGTCQDTWEHGVPKARHAQPRMSVMFRPAVPERS